MIDYIGLIKSDTLVALYELKIILIGGCFMEKEFEIIGTVAYVSDNMSSDEFLDIIIQFVESKNWGFTGEINEIIDGYYINKDGTKGKYVLDETL